MPAVVSDKPLVWLDGEIKTFKKTTQQTPDAVIARCRQRLARYDAAKK